jgi:hypothetical protein
MVQNSVFSHGDKFLGRPFQASQSQAFLGAYGLLRAEYPEVRGFRLRPKNVRIQGKATLLVSIELPEGGDVSVFSPLFMLFTHVLWHPSQEDQGLYLGPYTQFQRVEVAIGFLKAYVQGLERSRVTPAHLAEAQAFLRLVHKPVGAGDALFPVITSWKQALTRGARLYGELEAILEMPTADLGQRAG